MPPTTRLICATFILMIILTYSDCMRQSPSHKDLVEPKYFHGHAKCGHKRSMFLPGVLKQLAPWSTGINAEHIEAAADYLRAHLPDNDPPRPDEWLHYDSKAAVDLNPDDKDFPWSSPALVKIACINNTWYLPAGPVPVTEGFNVLMGLWAPSLRFLDSLTESFKVPDLVLLYASGDFPVVFGPGENGHIPPVFHVSGQEDSYDLQLPDDYLMADHPFDTEWPHFVQTHTPSWEERKNTAIGRYNLVCPHYAKIWSRNHTRLECPRAEIHNLMSDPRNHDHILDAGAFMSADWTTSGNLPRVEVEEALQYKYYLNLPGFTTAFRLPYLLAGGWTVIHLITNPLYSWFNTLMQPWVHFVPFGYDSYDEIFDTIDFLNKNSQLAEQIAKAGQHFAQHVLAREGKECYLLTLLQEYSDRLSFDVGSLQDYPKAITLKEALNQSDFMHGYWVGWARENGII